MGDCVGIDLGTTYSICPNDQGNRTTPSVVGFGSKQRLVGEAAASLAFENVVNTVHEVKRLIGRGFDEVCEDTKRWPFGVTKTEGSKIGITVTFRGETKTFAPEEISAMVLVKMKQTAEARLGHSVSQAVITVPAYFTDAQRAATKTAGRIAGLEVMRIINEPTAAAIAYGAADYMTNKAVADSDEKTVLVFDLGGGTFDVSVVVLDGSGTIEVQATGGDTRLGGEDFDARLVNDLAETFKRRHMVDPRNDARAKRRLHAACERAKRALSSSTQAHVEIDSLCNGIDMSEKVTRARFETLNAPDFSRCLQVVESVLKDAKLKTVDEVLLVGGSTRIPKIRTLLAARFGASRLKNSLDADEAVAVGATIQAAILAGKSNECMDLVLLDVAPLSLGIRVLDKDMNTVIPRNTTIPIKHSKNYVTRHDNQTEINVSVYEGERAKTIENHYLGEFTIRDLPAKPRGDVKIDVTFDIDCNGILTVSATHGDTCCSITISDHRLSPTDVARMVEDSERFQADDQARRKRCDLINGLTAYCHSVRRQHVRSPAVLAKVQETYAWVDAYGPDAEEMEILIKRNELVNAVKRAAMASH